MSDDYSLIRYGVDYVASPQEATFISDTVGDSLENDIVLTDETFSLVLEVNKTQYEQLLSAGLNGAYRYFPENVIEVIWPLIKAGKIVFCDSVASCIENNLATQQAIADSISNSSIIQQAIADYIKQSGLNTPSGAIDPSTDTVNSVGAIDNTDRIGVIEDCNNDKLWGALRYGVVAYLADNALNFLEDLNTIADKGQRASNLVSGIPIVGDVLASTVSAFAEAIPDLLNLFNAHDSETVRDEIACELFQLGCNDCLLPTYGELIGYYSALGVTGFGDLENVAFQLATDLLVGSSTLTGSVVYHTIIAYELAVLYVGSKFNQAIGANIVNVWAEIGIDFANDNWLLLCGDCGDSWCYEVDFTLGSLGAWQLGNGTLTASGIQSTFVNGLAELSSVMIDAGESFTFQNCEVEYQYTVAGSRGSNDRVNFSPCTTITGINGNDGDVTTGQYQWVRFIPPTTTDITTQQHNVAASGARQWLKVHMYDYGTAGQTVYLRRIKLWGEGQKPLAFPASNC